MVALLADSKMFLRLQGRLFGLLDSPSEEAFEQDQWSRTVDKLSNLVTSFYGLIYLAIPLSIMEILHGRGNVLLPFILLRVVFILRVACRHGVSKACRLEFLAWATLLPLLQSFCTVCRTGQLRWYFDADTSLTAYMAPIISGNIFSVFLNIPARVNVPVRCLQFVVALICWGFSDASASLELFCGAIFMFSSGCAMVINRERLRKKMFVHNQRAKSIAGFMSHESRNQLFAINALLLGLKPDIDSGVDNAGAQNVKDAVQKAHELLADVERVFEDALEMLKANSEPQDSLTTSQLIQIEQAHWDMKAELWDRVIHVTSQSYNHLQATLTCNDQTTSYHVGMEAEDLRMAFVRPGWRTRKKKTRFVTENKSSRIGGGGAGGWTRSWLALSWLLSALRPNSPFFVAFVLAVRSLSGVICIYAVYTDSLGWIVIMMHTYLLGYFEANNNFRAHSGPQSWGDHRNRIHSAVQIEPLALACKILLADIFKVRPFSPYLETAGDSRTWLLTGLPFWSLFRSNSFQLPWRKRLPSQLLFAAVSFYAADLPMSFDTLRLYGAWGMIMFISYRQNLLQQQMYYCSSLLARTAGFVAHNSRNGIFAIDSQLTAAEVDNGRRDTYSEFHRSIGKVRQSLGVIESIFTEALDMLHSARSNHLHHPHINYTCAPFRLAKLIEMSKDHVAGYSQKQDKRIKFSVTVNEESLLQLGVMCKSREIIQAVQNVLSNALSFAATTVSMHLFLKLVEGNNNDKSTPGPKQRTLSLLLRIRDDGPGLPSSTDSKFNVFGAWTQAGNQEIRHKYKGSGIGLSLARDYIERGHGGVITLASYGQGDAEATHSPVRQLLTEHVKGCECLIQLALPVVYSANPRSEQRRKHTLEVSATAAARQVVSTPTRSTRLNVSQSFAASPTSLDSVETRPQASSDPALLARKYHPWISGMTTHTNMVLLVDDQPFIRQCLKIQLVRLVGIAEEHIDEVEDGSEALANVKAGCSYMLIIMDYSMPVMRGDIATISIRKTGYAGPILGLTGKDSGGIMAENEGNVCWADAVFMKGSNMAPLIAAVRALLSCHISSKTHQLAPATSNKQTIGTKKRTRLAQESPQQPAEQHKRHRTRNRAEKTSIAVISRQKRKSKRTGSSKRKHLKL